MEKIKLPNGDEFYCINISEARLLYTDLFEDRSYFQFGITIEAGATVVDVGANIGLFALLASREAKGVRIISVEPLPPIYSVLKANYDLHMIRGEVFPYGVGRNMERVDFTFYSSNTALSGCFADMEEEKNLLVRILRNRLPDTPYSDLESLATLRLTKQIYKCDVKPLSNILRESDVERIGLLKIDVEKAELDVLESIEDDDWRRIDQLVVEVHNIDNRLQRVCELFRARGYEVQCKQGSAFSQTNLYDTFAYKKNVGR
jgi:FkbM family methyltransferase